MRTPRLAKQELSPFSSILAVTVPEPSSIPAVKEYRYVKAKDEIVPTSLPVKAQKNRYANAVWQVTVRALHEIFEADRAGKTARVAQRGRTDGRDPEGPPRSLLRSVQMTQADLAARIG